MAILGVQIRQLMVLNNRMVLNIQLGQLDINHNHLNNNNKFQCNNHQILIFNNKIHNQPSRQANKCKYKMLA